MDVTFAGVTVRIFQHKHGWCVEHGLKFYFLAKEGLSLKFTTPDTPEFLMALEGQIAEFIQKAFG